MYPMPKNEAEKYKTMTILRPYTNRIYSMRKFSSGLKENANGNNIP